MTKRIFHRAKRYIPWVVAILIFVYLFHEYEPSQLYKALENANILYFLTLAIIYFLILYVVDCYSMSYALTRFGHPVSLKELWPARGVTYLIMNINYPASQAAFAYYLKRTRNIPIFEVLSVFFFIAVIDLYLIMTVALVGSFFQDAVIRGVDIGAFVRTIVIVSYVIFILQFAFWRGWFSRITGIKIEFRIIKWLRSKKIFIVFNDATFTDYLKLALMRLPIHISIVLFLYIAVRAFYTEVPLISVVGNVPIAFLIGTIPITPGGLGTTNIALVELMHDKVSGKLISSGIVTAKELILTVTILWMFVNYTIKSLVGVVWLQKVSKQLFKPTEPDIEEKVESEASTTRLAGDV